MRFGTGLRGSLEAPNARKVPGPGEHSPDFKVLRNEMPKFGFGSETRKDVALERSKAFPGPGNYKINGLIGAEGTSKTMHSTIKYSPAQKENSYKPGPGMYDANPLNVK